jgi:resuscitation-promoting factor RpfB
VPGTYEVWSTVLFRPKIVALQATIVTALVGGTTAFVTFDKTVTVSVDGEAREVRSFARTVGDVLEREDIEIDHHDLVSPDLESSVKDGQTIVVRNGRLLTLTIDGKQRKVWVTAKSVEEALGQLGIRAEGARLSASRSTRIPLDGLALELRSPKGVTVLVDGRRRAFETTTLTVREALAEARITVDRDDQVSPSIGSRLIDGTLIKIVRVKSGTVVETYEIPFKTTRRADSSMEKGEERVLRKGSAGARQTTFRVVYRDGKLTQRQPLTTRVTEQPVTEIVAYGTKAPAPVPVRKATGVEDLNWAALAQCESGGNPDAVNPAGPYYGLYQFSLSTWQSVGGSGVPTDSSGSEQTYRAQLLYKRSGAGQWPVCGSRLFS